MTDSPFIHLAVRSSYSLLESMMSPKQLAAWCVAQGMPAMAVADRNSLFGALEISECFAGNGVQPIMACTLDILHDRHRGETASLRLYAMNETGYGRLMELSSLAYLESQNGVPGLALEHVFEKTEGLICLTGGGQGHLGQLLATGREKEARAWLERLLEAYGDRLYVELQRHGAAEEAVVEPLALELAYEMGLPIVATHDARFEKPGDHGAHDALMCIAAGKYLGQDDRPKVTPRQYLKTPQEMAELFADLPEAIETTGELARRCAVRHLPLKPILPTFAENENEELRRQATEGLEQRLAGAEALYAEREDYFARLDHELGIIAKMGFPGYFLIVSDFIKWAKEQGIPVGPGRGSGAGSLVAWSLLITDLDPLRFDLLFERFLNPERISMPDFDVDFCQERRGEVIRYVRDKYGAENVCAIITFGTLQAKAVVRDVGRVMQMPFYQVDRLAKLIPFNPANPPKLADAIRGEPKFAEAKAEDPQVGELLDTALALEGLYRNASTHAAGVVIADRPITRVTPVYRDPRSDLPATQFNMKWAEESGLVKFDFLGLKTLTVIKRALGFLERQGITMPAAWDRLDDPETYELMKRGDTLGVFQLEGQGMRDTLKKVKPGNIEDVIAIISLYRPGPMDNIPVYVAGKENPSNIRYDHPDLKPILEATYGVPVYQEQVMLMAQEIAGYSLGEADILRRAMGKKKAEEMDRQRVRFVEGAAERKGMDEGLANQIFDTMAKFAGYGFNKSHAAAYAVIGYQTAYLKCHHPVEFLAASMSLDIHNTDKLAAFAQEARRNGIEIRLPDVNRSTADFDVDDGAIVYALGAIKGVGLEAMNQLVAARREGGTFGDLHDFAERVDPRFVNKKCFESLARSGAFDGLEPNRARVLEAVPALVSHAASTDEDRRGGQGGLFEDSKESVRPPLPASKAWSSETKLMEEFKAVGFYLSGHPLDDLFLGRARDRLTLASEIAERAQDRPMMDMAGIVRARVEKPARDGGKFAYVTLSDPSGDYEAMVVPEMLGEVRELLEVGAAVFARIRARVRDEEIRLFVDNVMPLEEADLGPSEGLLVAIGAGCDLAGLKGALEAAARRAGGRGGEVHLATQTSRGEVQLRLPGRFPVGLKMRQLLKTVAGVDRVDDLVA